MRRFKAICDQTRSKTWHVLDTQTNRKIVDMVPGWDAKDKANALNNDSVFRKLYGVE